MKDFRYLSGVASLRVDEEKCVGCGDCLEVCPHGVLKVEKGKATAVDHDACMECGACAKNCPAGAISLTPGVGCAAYIIQTWLKGRGGVSCC
ncbi:MAG: 4Fe-4S binding protein [Proteobacteria bacterium]|nr:4Fe-4S binding protein [Pseudomonadota bacterium]